MPINSFKDDEKTVETGKLKTLLRLFSYLLHYKKEIVGVLFIMAYCVVVSLLNPLIIESAIDDYIAKGNYRGLFFLILSAVALNVTMIFLVKLRMYVMAKVCNSVLLTVRQELYTHIQTLDFHFFDSRPTGKILSRIIGDINSLKEVLNNSVTTLIPDFITICAVVVIMVVKSPLLALASLSTLPILIVGLTLITTLSHKRWRSFRKKSSNLNAFIHEDISGIRIIQSFTAEEETKKTFHELVAEHFNAFKSAVRLNDAFGPLIDICWGVSTIALYYIGIMVLGIDSVSAGLLIAFGYYINMFWNPIANLSSFYNQIITNIAAADRIFEVLDTPPAITDKENAEMLSDITGEVSFEDVTFAYTDAPDIKVLEHVNFHITPGETIALVGPTGAGKTTSFSALTHSSTFPLGISSFVLTETILSLPPNTLTVEVTILVGLVSSFLA